MWVVLRNPHAVRRKTTHRLCTKENDTQHHLLPQVYIPFQEKTDVRCRTSQLAGLPVKNGIGELQPRE